MKKPFTELLADSIVVFDGAMGTMLYSKGIYINQCFEHLNCTRPHLISQIHREYCEAGADVIETNTFGANRIKLGQFGLAEKVQEINMAGAQLVHAVAGEEKYVAAAIGPLGKPLEPYGTISLDEAGRWFLEQAQALIAGGGIDLFILETFSSLSEISAAISAVRSVSALPILAQMTVGENQQTIYGETPAMIVKELEGQPVQAVGLNCSVGPAVMLECIEQMREASQIPLSAQPNAGLPRQIEGRLIYLSTPEYMAEYAKRMIQTGVTIVGSCCGSMPAHTKAIRAAVKALRPRQHVEIKEPVAKPQPHPAAVEPCAPPTAFAQKVREGKFVVSVEIDPPWGTNPSSAVAAARLLHEHQIDAINIADGPRASARMSPMALAILLKQEVDIETILHYCCRDRNILGMQADLLGAHALGLHNLLLITGDPPKLGDYPFATAVFDVDSIGLLRITQKLNRGCDLSDNPIGEPTCFFLGVGANHGAIDLDEEVRRFEKKVESGAEYVLTQPVFDIRLLENFLKRIEAFHIPLLVGILPLISSRNAEFLHNEVPGMQIPDAIRERMRQYGKGPRAQAEGIAIAQEVLRAARPMVQGAYFMPPFGRVDTVLKILEILG